MTAHDLIPPATGKAAGRSRTLLRRVAVGLAACALVGGVVLGLRGRAPSTGHARPTAEVPRVEGKRVVFSEHFRERVGLTSVPVKRAPLTPRLSVVGTVAFDAEHTASIGTRARGIVRQVLAFEGSVVRKGDVLATIDSADLGEAQASIWLLEAQLDAARKNAAREERLAGRQLSTQRELEQARAEFAECRAKLRAARQRVSALSGGASGGLGVHRLRSPLEGTVVERKLSLGQSVEAEHTAFLVSNLDTLWVELGVHEQSLGGLRLGDAADVRPLGLPDQRFSGQIAHISHTVDSETRSAVVRVKVANRDRKLRPGQAVDATLESSGSAVQSALLIPVAAVTFVDGRPTVFVQDGPLSVIATEVVLGASNGSEHEVRAGVSPGQQVVSEGVFALKSELFR